MGVEIGTANPDQAEAFIGAMGKSFGFDIEDPERLRRFTDNFEWDRSRVAYDGERIVGTSGAFSLTMTVPGEVMACGGTTVVSVLPTHRRQGILRSMMDAHLDDVRERGEPIAALWASDSAIYGRFGYGCVSRTADVRVPRTHAAFHRLAPDPAPIRLIDRDEARQLLPPFYDQVRTTFPGFFARSQKWWDNRRFRDERDDRDGATAYRYAVTETGGEVTGFVQYRFKERWDDGHAQGEVRIRELVGSDPTAWTGLWRFVLDHDLTAAVQAPTRSLDDPLFELLAGRRRAKFVDSGDNLWVRIMDPKAALEGRRFSTVARMVIDVRDPIDGTNSVWEIDLSPEGATVSSTTADATVAMDLEDLSACFMGWSRFEALHRTGRVLGEREDVVALDRAFSWSPAPWCPEVF